MKITLIFACIHYGKTEIVLCTKFVPMTYSVFLSWVKANMWVIIAIFHRHKICANEPRRKLPSYLLASMMEILRKHRICAHEFFSITIMEESKYDGDHQSFYCANEQG